MILFAYWIQKNGCFTQQAILGGKLVKFDQVLSKLNPPKEAIIMKVIC